MEWCRLALLSHANHLTAGTAQMPACATQVKGCEALQHAGVMCSRLPAAPPNSVVAPVLQLSKLLPDLDCLLPHELQCGYVAVRGGLCKLLVEVLVLKAAVLLHVLGGGGVEDLVDARPVAGAHAHGAGLRAGVQHAATQVGGAQARRRVPDGTNLTVPAQHSITSIISQLASTMVSLASSGCIDGAISSVQHNENSSFNYLFVCYFSTQVMQTL